MTSFTPEARVVAAFTVVVALLLGTWTSIAALVHRTFAAVDLEEQPNVTSLVSGIVVVAVAVAALLVARTASEQAAAAWARHVGQASVIVAVLVIAGAVVGTLAAMFDGGRGVGYYG